MRFVVCNSHEFDHPSAEENLLIGVGSHSEYAHLPQPGKPPREATADALLAAFVEHCSRLEGQLDGGSQVPWDCCQPISFHSLSERSMVAAHLAKFAHVDIPLHSETPVYVINNTWDDKHFVIAAHREMIWYHWYTTA